MLYGERTWTDIERLRERVVVLPLGSLEQHGHHLPLLTDTLLGAEVARRAAAELGDAALFLPTLWIGASDHHRAYAGTVSLSNETYAQVIADILESLVGAGFRRILLLNAHGGNITPAHMAMYRVQLRHRAMPELYIAFASWWQIAADQVRALAGGEQESVTHACELETSMVLRLRPELVRLDAAEGANIPFDSAFYCPDFSRASRVDVPRPFELLSRSGAFGHPERATPERGEELFVAAAAEVVAFVREFAAWPALRPH
ncbi:MAG TPA: creatininase family protein [Roseiflexaceae bacterium]|nr:creatininase family protein [Roseiflexaceae bacterium]